MINFSSFKAVESVNCRISVEIYLVRRKAKNEKRKNG